MIVSRVYLYHPALVRAIFTLGTPYLPPSPHWQDFDEMILEKPTFEYQRHFGSSEFEDYFKSNKEVREFFNATFGGRGPNGELGFSTKGPLVDNWRILHEGTVLSKKVRKTTSKIFIDLLKVFGRRKSSIMSISILAVAFMVRVSLL